MEATKTSSLSLPPSVEQRAATTTLDTLIRMMNWNTSFMKMPPNLRDLERFADDSARRMNEWSEPETGKKRSNLKATGKKAANCFVCFDKDIWPFFVRKWI